MNRNSPESEDIKPSTESQSKLAGSQAENESTSIFQTLNNLVYLLFFSGIIYYMNRDYDNIATKWFVITFPREAETLRFHVEL